jgi:hypothetical protein
MPDFDISSESGEQFSIGGQITKPATVGQAPPWPNYPSNAAGHKLTFTAKRRKSDVTPLVKRDNVADPTNVSLANGGLWSVKILTADTAAFAKTEELLYDVTLTEPSGGDITVISEGTWTVEKSVGL